MLDTNLFNNIDKYHFSPQLRDAVRVAEHLQMPLLLTGEPGTGKTKIADALQQVLGKELNEDILIHTFDTKSISVFKDLIYKYDYLKHFQNVQLGTKIPDNDFEKEYITYNALGEAIKANKKSIVLIDEVDKAPRDFPNDLLDILGKTEKTEKTYFEVPELQKIKGAKSKFETDNKPFIVITSNSEKSLPDAFLRRCIYFHIPFPEDEVLTKILLKHFEGKPNIENNMQTIETWFSEVRKDLYRKKPSTAELISWLQVMETQDFPFEKLNYGDTAALSEQEKETLKMSFSVIAKTQDDYEKISAAHT